MHPFVVESNSAESLFCTACQSKLGTGFCLRCSPCKLDLHIKCGWSAAIIEGRSHHEHPFVRFFRDAIFTCDACGTQGNYVSYICHSCNFQVHLSCTSLPHIIKTTRHHHSIVHRYFLQGKEFEKQECQLCFREVKAEHGNYSCWKQDCDFVAHVKCAMDLEMYYEIDEANVDQDESSSEILASITRVIERNEDGEATMIEHFSHEHYLTLGNNVKGDDDKRCYGCMLSIFSTNSFYSCSQCEFLLHKACAELPRKNHLWFYQAFTTLNLVDIFRCDQCSRLSSGFVYEGVGSDLFCLRCARISHTFGLTFQGHKHCIFFDFSFQGECNACGAQCRHGGFKCKDCTLALDFACITLREPTRHKCDKHILTLASHDENDDPEQHYCDVCEEKRDPNRWFYHCAICDNSAHPKCILGELPFVKMGVTLPISYGNPHRHPLIFAEGIYEICSKCDKRCHDEVALECKEHCTDNYIIHLGCLSDF